MLPLPGMLHRLCVISFSYMGEAAREGAGLPGMLHRLCVIRFSDMGFAVREVDDEE